MDIIFIWVMSGNSPPNIYRRPHKVNLRSQYTFKPDMAFSERFWKGIYSETKILKFCFPIKDKKA